MQTFAVMAPDRTHYVDIEEPAEKGPHFNWHDLVRAEVVRLGLMTEEQARFVPILAANHPPKPHPVWR